MLLFKKTKKNIYLSFHYINSILDIMQDLTIDNNINEKEKKKLLKMFNRIIEKELL